MSTEPENPMQSHPDNSENRPDSTKPLGFDEPSMPPPFKDPPPFNQFGGNFGGQQNLPNSTATLILGILSIPACCFYGVIGIVFGIIALVLGNGDIKKYNLNPNLYTIASLKNSKAGKICGIIGLSLSALYIIILILVIGGLISNPSFLQQLNRMH